MRPHWDSHNREWVDLDEPVSDDPDDGHCGISDTEVEREITNLTARIAELEAQLAEAQERNRNLLKHASELERGIVHHEDIRLKQAALMGELEAQLREAVILGELLAEQNNEARTERAELEEQLAEVRGVKQ